MHDRRAHLRLDIVADDRDAALLEAAAPVGLAREEDRHAVDKGTAGLEHLLGIPLDRFLTADRQVIDHDVGPGGLEDADDVGGRAGGLGNDLGEVLTQPIMGHAALDLDSQMGYVRELDRVVVSGEDRVREVLTNLIFVDVEGGGELDITDVVPAQVDVHQSGDRCPRLRVAVILDALDQRRGAVAHTQDRDPHLATRPRIAPNRRAP